jgi:hypothetical protein
MISGGTCRKPVCTSIPQLMAFHHLQRVAQPMQQTLFRHREERVDRLHIRNVRVPRASRAALYLRVSRDSQTTRISGSYWQAGRASRVRRVVDLPHGPSRPFRPACRAGHGGTRRCWSGIDLRATRHRWHRPFGRPMMQIGHGFCRT